MIDKDEYPQTAEIENRCVHILADLWHSPKSADTIHVDAASGGFIAPFIQEKIVWDFRLPRVKSINASGHKYGLSPLGVGWVVWREKEDLPEELIFRVNYLGGDMPTFALNFSRPGGQIIAQYYNLVRHGREGYRRIQQVCLDHGIYIAEEVKKLGLFELLYDGKSALPGAAWMLKDGIYPGFNLYDLSDRMRTRGWQVASYSLPANCQDMVIQRVLIRHGFSRDMAGLFIEDLKRSIDYFQKNPVSHGFTEKEAGGFHH